MGRQPRRIAVRAAKIPAGSDSPQLLRTQLERSIESAGLSSALAQLSVNGSLFDLRFEGVQLRYAGSASDFAYPRTRRLAAPLRRRLRRSSSWSEWSENG